ncbi:MAG: hypothetical protein RIQ55_506 [Pseudomonadota bacterium]|jgi:membrane protease subunit HflK
MSINDPQWGNSHRPEEKKPEQVPEVTGTEPVQPEEGGRDTPPQKSSSQLPRPSPKTPPPEGPPDLEELWQQLVYQTRCKLARVFGKEPPPPPQFTPLPAPSTAPPVDEPLASWQSLSFKSWLIGVSLIIGAWLVSGFYLVDAQQRGILSRFGTVMSVENPGWHWRWPYPVDSVRLINVAADRTLEVGLAPEKNGRSSPGLMLTSDGNLVGVSYAVVYQVTDPVAYVAQADAPVDVLALLAESAIRDLVSEQTLPSMLGAASVPSTAGKPVLQVARDRLQALLDPFAIGIVVKDLVIREVQLPAPVLQSVKEAERQEQASAKALRETQAAATERLIQTHKLAAKLQDESTAYARALENTAATLRNAAALDKAQAAQMLANHAAAWRQQYPLVFASPAELQARIQPKAAGRSADAAGSDKTGVKATPEVTDNWRDRDLMRTRDRVDRPGSGS